MMTAAILGALATLALLFWGVCELVAHIRWQRFLKLLDERLGDRADGSRVRPPRDFELFHNGTHNGTEA